MSLDLFPDLVCQRVFLGWDSPFLPAVARYLIDQHRDGHRLDLSDWMLALPSTQSAHRLWGLLNQSADDGKLDFLAPRILTAGDLAEALYDAQKPIAIEFEQTLAWSRVLRSQDPESLRPLLPVLPESESLGPWLELAGTLRRLGTDLATHEVTFADVLRVSETDAERARWQLLENLSNHYLAELSQAGLSDQHQQRRHAISRKKIRSPKRIALVGTSDLNESVAKVVAEVDRELISMIAAPQRLEVGFDWLGRLKTEAFAELKLPLADEQLLPGGDISDQAIAVSEVVADFRSRFEPGEIAVGTTDDSHVAPTEMQLDGCGLPSYRHVGWTISSTAVGRLIELTTALVARPTWRSLAALVRHGDVHRFLRSGMEDSESEFLVDLDQLLANHFPVRLSDPLPPAAIKNHAASIELRDRVTEWLSPFLGGRVKKSSDRVLDSKPIADWCVLVMEWLDSIYTNVSTEGSESVDRHLSIEAVTKVRNLLSRFANLSGHLDVHVSAAAALETLGGRIADLRVGHERRPGDVQIHGWLDLALDDSPAMVVIGFNHPFVPSAVTSDPFLPGSLRSKLRIADNDRRYARDVYAMQLMLSTRKETDLKFVVGKRSADGSPTPPSRLLAAADPAAIARRVRMLLGGKRTGRPPSHRWENNLESTQLPIPQITTTECPVQTMSVTAFKAYLECPYRFYLRYVLKLKPIDDSASELAANQFGDLVHGAVENFGDSDAKDEEDESRIFEALRHHLDVYAAKNYGDHVESAVRLQIRQAERRLRFVAKAQADRIGAGWRIHATEASVDESKGACIKVDGKKMGLRGRFDRIDRHLDDGQYAILDYKTHGVVPLKKHLKKNRGSGEYEWIDLQLPLYRLMVPFLGIDVPPETVQLGYFNVSDKRRRRKSILLNSPSHKWIRPIN